MHRQIIENSKWVMQHVFDLFEKTQKLNWKRTQNAIIENINYEHRESRYFTYKIQPFYWLCRVRA